MKLKALLTLAHAILFATLLWFTGWIVAVALSGLLAAATFYWIEPIRKLVGKILRPSKSSGISTPPPVPPPDMGDYGSRLSKAESILACLAGIALIVSVISALTLCLIGSWHVDFTIGNKTYITYWFPLLLILTGLYVAGSFQQVNEDENAVKIAFGYMFEDVGPGLTFVPRWACKLVRVTSKVRTLAGGTPEKVKAAERGESLGVAATEQFTQAQLVQSDAELLETSGGTIRVSEEATRVTFAERKTAKYFRGDKGTFEGKTTNPLSSQFTTDPKIVMGLLIPKEGIRMLVRRFGSPFGALREIDELMTSHMQVLCSRITAEYFVYRVDDIALMLQLILEKLLGDTDTISGSGTVSGKRMDECFEDLQISLDTIQSLGRTGVDIKSLRLETGLPKGVNLSLKGVVQADINIQTAEKEGEAVRLRLEKEGAGKASAVRALKTAEADGKKASLMADAAGREAIIKATDSDMGRLLAGLETLKDALSSNSKVVIAKDGTDILGLVTGITQTIRQQLEGDKTKVLGAPPTSNPATSPTTT